MDQLQHSDHEHPLILHKSCAEFPKTIITMLHPAHQLDFYHTDFFKDERLTATCEICKIDIFLKSERYGCSRCYLHFHVTCALENTFEPASHDQHSFRLFKPTSFTCDACGELEIECISCICTTCHFQIHKTCSDIHFPHTLKQKGHPAHPVTLTYSYQRPHDFVSKPCKICYRQIEKELCFYQCGEDCDYYAHLKCATSERLRDDDDDGSSRRGEENQMIYLGEGKLKHFSHEHFLILVSNDDDDHERSDEICFGCARPMTSSGPFYKCHDDQCNFLLHQQCAELSNEIIHPLHAHLLTLVEKCPSNDFGMFQCCGCNVSCNGFTYMCSDCDDFFLCVGCSLFSDTLQHEGHPCTLSLISNGIETECNACGLGCSTKFMSEGSKFSIDLRCASLPLTTRGKCPNHDGDNKCLFVLMFWSEDESGEYYCDFCDEPRGKYHWFYYCVECKMPFHPQCIVDRFMYTFGKTYQLGCHPHSLTLVRKAEDNGRPFNCASCDDHHCKDMPILVCAKCDFYCHPWLPKDPLQHSSHKHVLKLEEEGQDTLM